VRCGGFVQLGFDDFKNLPQTPVDDRFKT
jgi:hypothetical protein